MLVISVLSRATLASGIALLLWTILPNVVGLQTSSVLSGSMSPTLAVGDAVVVRPLPPDRLRVGQVLLVDDPDRSGALRLHRLVRIDGSRLVTKGDANAAADSSPVALSAVHGAAFLRIPYAGLPTLWIRTGQVLPLLATGAAAALLVAGARLDRLLADPDERPRRRHRSPRRTAMRRTVAAGAVLVAVTGALASTPTGAAEASYAAATSTPSSGFASRCGYPLPAVAAALAPSLAWSFSEASGSAVLDSSGNAASGSLTGAYTRTTCAGGHSPFVTLAGGAGSATAASLRPASVSIAMWFRTTSTTGGVLADFGNAATGASTLVDKPLYLTSSGRIGFGGQSVAVAGVSSPLVCLTPSATDYADGIWHFVVATFSAAALGLASSCAISLDGAATPVATNSSAGITLLSNFSGFWRIGGDAVTSTNGWPLAPATTAYRGDLDEVSCYAAALTSAQAATLFAAGR